MTYIVVTNDDGVFAPGLLALTMAMRELGRVSVIAPSINQSASGHKKTLHQDIPYSQVALADGTPAISVGGSPADCIGVGALGLIEWPPDIVVSGINRGPNVSQDITYSGTVTAALESVIHGVPAVAVSLDNRVANDIELYRESARVAAIVTARTLQKQLPPLTILNLNTPNSDQIKGIRLTRQGVRIYQDELDMKEDVVRVVGPDPGGMTDEEGTDLWAVHNGYASLTPIHLDMTAHRFMADLAAWDITTDSPNNGAS
ncbi:MAG: 5'/3'-nucleotidase SurE [Chloroflexi bacterium]|nr:5'/3'-nucleotidase SurE [Chloroflexota bacterium]